MMIMPSASSPVFLMSVPSAYSWYSERSRIHCRWSSGKSLKATTAFISSFVVDRMRKGSLVMIGRSDEAAILYEQSNCRDGFGWLNGSCDCLKWQPPTLHEDNFT